MIIPKVDFSQIIIGKNLFEGYFELLFWPKSYLL